MFAAIYCWKVKVGYEAQFERGWALGTERIAEELGGWGSRLHRAADGTYFAYAEWPDEATWQRAVSAGMPHSDEEARRLYRDAFEPDSFEVVFAGPVVCDRLGLCGGGSLGRSGGDAKRPRATDADSPKRR